MSDLETEPESAAEFARRPSIRWLVVLLLLVAAALTNGPVFAAARTGATSPPFGARVVQFNHTPELFVGLFLVRVVVALVCDGLLLLAVRSVWRSGRSAARRERRD